MRIAVFSDTVYPQINGVSQVLEQYLAYMNEKDLEFVLFVPEKESSTDQQNIFHFGGVKIFFYPEIRIAYPGYARIKHLLDAFQPDIIHLLTPFTLGLLGMKYARKHDIPMVSSYHTNLDQYLQYYGLQFMQKTLEKYLKWFHSASQITFCPSQASLFQLRQLGINNAQICPNGVDINSFSPQYRNLTIRQALLSGKEGPLLLYVGRLAPEKNLEVLMQAVKILNDKQAAFQLVMVGNGPSRKSLESMNIDQVTFLGFQSGRTLRELYASADIFVFPSTTETFGNAVLEAMSSGLPVIAPGIGGIKDNLKNLHNGLSVRPGDAYEMAYAIHRLIQDQELRAALSANAINYAAGMSWTDIFDGFFAQLDLLLNTFGINALTA